MKVKEAWGKVKETVSSITKSAIRIVHNGEHFVQAVSLLTIAAYSYFKLRVDTVQGAVYWLVAFSLVVIGARGAWEFLKFLDAERKQIWTM